MKKFIYIFGIVLLNIFAFGAIFKIMHWPGAGILLTIGMCLFALVFLPMAFINNYRGSDKQHLSLYISGFICAIICVIGALFKIQHWPGSNYFMIIGVPLPFLYFLPVYLYHQKKEKNKSVLHFLGVMFLLLYISVFSAFLSLSVGRDILNSIAISSVDFSNTTELYTLKNKLMYEKLDRLGSFENKEKVSALKDKTSEINAKIQSVKRELVVSLEGPDSPAIQENKISIAAIVKKDEVSLTEKIIRGADGVSGRALEIKRLVTSYKEFIDKMLAGNSESLGMIDELLNTADVPDSTYGEVYTKTWEDSFFTHGAYIVAVLGNLDCVAINVKMAEAEALSALKCK
jgi:hypothetical protein